MSEWIDISTTISPQMMTWPDQPAVKISKILSIENDDPANLSHLSLSVHTGTHMDAPLHFLDGGSDITTVPLESVIGPARVIEIKDLQSIKTAELEVMNIQKGQRILFKTTNSSMDWVTMPFNPEFVYLSTEAAIYLAEKEITCVGIDYPSIAGYKKNESSVHRNLLNAGVWIIEGLMLQDVDEGDYDMICLPLKIAGSDGAPARVLIKEINL